MTLSRVENQSWFANFTTFALVFVVCCTARSPGRREVHFMPSRSSVIHPTHPHVIAPAAYIQAPAPLILCPPPAPSPANYPSNPQAQPFLSPEFVSDRLYFQTNKPPRPTGAPMSTRPPAAGRSLESPEPQLGPPPQFQHSHYIQVSYSSRSDGRRETVPAGHRRPLNPQRIDGKLISEFVAVRGLHGGAEVDAGVATWCRPTCVLMRQAST
ncbi:hypothetical protein EDB80DRAFT_720473 [Ilyonectria destructans]|nr:hypothetical protein EDB80DRAFT_720473 [Ilyonectria destructans]